MNPLISIITPTYNRAYILPVAVDSIQNQTYDNWELIIIDDGSTDVTAQYLEHLQKDDNRVRSYTQENAGQSVARNLGLENAQGEYITYLDSDNEFLPECLQVLVKALQDHPSALYAMPQGKRTLELLEDGEVVKTVDTTEEEFPESLAIQDIFHRKLHTDLNAFMHHRSVTDSGIRFDPLFHRMEDWDFIMQIGEAYPDGFVYVPKVLYHYHQRYGGDGAVSNTSYREWAELFEKMYQKHKDDVLMQGQTWYPDRVEHWNDIQKQYEQGDMPPPDLYRFRE